jgi:hypothetical protein
MFIDVIEGEFNAGHDTSTYVGVLDTITVWKEPGDIDVHSTTTTRTLAFNCAAYEEQTDKRKHECF